MVSKGFILLNLLVTEPVTWGRLQYPPSEMAKRTQWEHAPSVPGAPEVPCFRGVPFLHLLTVHSLGRQRAVGFPLILPWKK